MRVMLTCHVSGVVLISHVLGVVLISDVLGADSGLSCHCDLSLAFSFSANNQRESRKHPFFT